MGQEVPQSPPMILPGQTKDQKQEGGGEKQFFPKTHARTHTHTPQLKTLLLCSRMFPRYPKQNPNPEHVVSYYKGPIL